MLNRGRSLLNGGESLLKWRKSFLKKRCSISKRVDETRCSMTMIARAIDSIEADLQDETGGLATARPKKFIGRSILPSNSWKIPLVHMHLNHRYFKQNHIEKDSDMMLPELHSFSHAWSADLSERSQVSTGT